MHSDDGIVVRLPDSDAQPPGAFEYPDPRVRAQQRDEPGVEGVEGAGTRGHRPIMPTSRTSCPGQTPINRALCAS